VRLCPNAFVAGATFLASASICAADEVGAAATGAPGNSAMLLVAAVAAIAAGVAVYLGRRLGHARVESTRLRADLEAATIETRRLLSESAERDAVLDAIPLPIWWRDPDARLIGCNIAYAEAIDEEGRGLAKRAAQTGIAMTESHYVVSGGARHLLEFTETPIAGPDGRVAGIARDVSALEEIQSDLASHIAAHGDVLESLGTAISIFGPDQRLKFFNSAYAHLWNIEPAVLRGEPTIGEVLELLRERRTLPEYVDFPAFKREQERLFVSLIERQENLIHLPDGRTLRQMVSPHPFGGLLYLHEDVTDRLVLERSYNTLIEVQRATLNNLYEGVAVFSGDGRLQIWNPTLNEMWHIDDDFGESQPHFADVVEQTRHLFPPAENWPERKEKLILSITEPRARSGRLERTDGVVLDFACMPLPDGGCLVSYVDVTDSVQVQRALEKRNLALEMADQIKTEFIGNVSYELRTPLNSIAGFSDILSQKLFGDLNARQMEVVGDIITASGDLRERIDEILDLATIEAGYLTLELEEVEVARILEGARDMVAAQIESGRLSLEIDCPADIGAIIADRARLVQAIRNILWTAVAFDTMPGRIKLSASRQDDRVSIEIANWNTAEPASAFDEHALPFGHGDPYMRRSSTSIGLNLSKSLVELHGGELVFESDSEDVTGATAWLPVSGPLPKGKFWETNQ
jgi:signal transduction histidine kinase